MKNEPSASSGRAQARQRSEPEVRNIFSHIFDFFGELRNDGTVVELSGRLFERTNIDPKTLAGQRFPETVFWQSRESIPDRLQTAIDRCASGETVTVELEFRVSAGEKELVEVTLVPQPASIFIASRVRLTPFGANQYSDLMAAAETAEIGLWVWDFIEDRIFATPRCNEILNISNDVPLTFSGFLDAVHPEDRPAVEHFINHSRDEDSKYQEEFRVMSEDGGLEWICAEGRFYAGLNGKPERLMGVLRRITQEKAAALELAQVYERETKARDEAVDANRAKDFFLAFVSHELRSPLNAILGWSKILLTKQVDEETRINALQTIERSARFQTKLIDDLVDSARVASGKLKLEYRPANLYEIVNSSFQAQTPTAAAHSIEFDFVSDSDSIPIFGDAGRLQQVFGNLLSNALKFTPDGGCVSIDIQTSRDNAIVTVTDTGQGIEKEALPNIFRQFSQGDLTQVRRDFGLGLGLSIVNILVAKHGGSVTAESDGPGTGSKFTVTMPLSLATDAGEHQAAAAPVNSRPLAGVNILLVEDDADSREVLHLFLEQSGAAVRSTDSASGAFGALTSAKDDLPHILISDLAMPDEDGYSLVAKIRNMPPDAGGTLPAIALSAFTTPESRKRAFEAGFSRYLTKPFEPDSLIDEILDLAGPRAPQ